MLINLIEGGVNTPLADIAADNGAILTVRRTILRKSDWLWLDTEVFGGHRVNS